MSLTPLSFRQIISFTSPSYYCCYSLSAVIASLRLSYTYHNWTWTGRSTKQLVMHNKRSQLSVRFHNEASLILFPTFTPICLYTIMHKLDLLFCVLRQFTSNNQETLRMNDLYWLSLYYNVNTHTYIHTYIRTYIHRRKWLAQWRQNQSSVIMILPQTQIHCPYWQQSNNGLWDLTFTRRRLSSGWRIDVSEKTATSIYSDTEANGSLWNPCLSTWVHSVMHQNT